MHTDADAIGRDIDDDDLDAEGDEPKENDNAISASARG